MDSSLARMLRARNAGAATESVRGCPVCSGRRAPVDLRPDGVPLGYCGECGLWYVAAALSEDDISSLYESYWLLERPRELTSMEASAILKRAAAFPLDDRISRIQSLLPFKRGARLLDVGCGCGDFLAGCRAQGFTVFGQEINKDSAAFVERYLEIPVFCGWMDPESFVAKNGAMDVVVMNDVIEHPIDPVRLLRSAVATLRPGGLVMLVTPNGGQACLHNKPAEWTGFAVDLEHLQYFSAMTFQRLAEKESLIIEHLESYGHPAYGEAAAAGVPAGIDVKGRLRTALKRSVCLARAWDMAASVRASIQGRSEQFGTYHLCVIMRKVH